MKKENIKKENEINELNDKLKYANNGYNEMNRQLMVLIEDKRKIEKEWMMQKMKKKIEKKLKKNWRKWIMNTWKKFTCVVLKKLEDEIVKMKNKDIPKLIPKTNPKKKMK